MLGPIHSYLQVVQGDPKCRALALMYCRHIHSFLHVVLRDPICRGLFIHTYMWYKGSNMSGPIHSFLHVVSVSEIKVVLCAPTGCNSLKSVHPAIYPCTLLICCNDKQLKKRAHSGCTPSEIVHPTAEMCTPGAGCTLNFGH